MKKLFLYCKSLFVSHIMVWKFFPTREFFEAGGILYTLTPQSDHTGPYFPYREYETLLNDYPDLNWRRSRETKASLGNEEASYDVIPERGFHVRVPKPIPNYRNIAKTLIILGVLMLTVTLFSINLYAGLVFISLLTIGYGGLIYYYSEPESILK